MGYEQGIALGALLLLIIPAAADPAPSPTAAPTGFRVIAVGDVPKETLVDVEEALIANKGRVVEALGLKEFPDVDVKVWESREAFGSAFQGDMPSGATGYINTELFEIRVLNSGNGTPRTAVHEMAHLAMLSVNRDIPMNPPWVWESVAQYLDDRPDSDTSLLTCIGEDRYPSLKTLAAFPKTVHVVRVGHLLMEYVVVKGGKKALRRLIETHGDLQETLGMTDAEFEQGWHEYLVSNYSFWPGAEPMSVAEVKAHLVGVPLLHKSRNNRILFLANGGIVTEDPDGDVSGSWSFDEQGRMCVDYSIYGGCAHWYADDGTFSYAPESDCLLQSWEPVPADA